MQIKPLLFATTLAFVSLATHAQTQAPGLWESTMNVKSQDGQLEHGMAEMQRRLAEMPPDQRAQAEALIAKSGIKVGASGTTVRACISKQQAARPPEPHMSGKCTTSDLHRTANSMKFKFACTQPHPYSGEGEWTFTSDKAYVGHMISMGAVPGQSQQMSIDMTGKWLSSDCGDIKPFVMPTK
jgi:hypothetical protein